MTVERKRGGLGIKWLIVGIPMWLALSGGVGLWLHFRQQEREKQDHKHAYRKDIDAKSLGDDFSKIMDVIGPRHDDLDASRLSLWRMASMIEGAMGLNNIGYEVTRAAGGEGDRMSAPVLMADVLRRKTSQEIWLIVPYDSPSALPRGQATASSVAVSLAAAQSLVGRKLEHNIRFLFVPAAHAGEGPRREAAAQVKRLIAVQGSPRLALVIGSMLHEGKLSLISRQDGTSVVHQLRDLLSDADDAAICSRENNEFSQLLAAMEIPSAHLCKRPESAMTALQEDAMPAAKNVMARSAEELVSVLLRLGGELQKN